MTLTELDNIYQAQGIQAVVSAIRDELNKVLDSCLECSAAGAHDHVDEVLTVLLGPQNFCGCTVEMASFRFKGGVCPHCGGVIG